MRQFVGRIIDPSTQQSNVLSDGLTIRPTVIAALILLLAVRPADAADAATAETAEEDWQVVFLQGQRVGSTHARTWETEVGGRTHIWTEVVTRMSIKRFGATLKMTVSQLTEEDDAGNLLTFEYESDNPPMSHSHISGRVEGDTLYLANTTAGKTTESTQPWDAEVKSPDYQERLLEEDPIEVGQSRSFKSFDPQLLKVGTITLRGEEPAETTLLDGTSRTLERVVMTHSLVPGLTTTMYSDDEHNVLKTEANLLSMVTFTVTQEEALKVIEGAELDLAVNTLVKVAPIENAHATQRIVYEMTLDRPQLAVDLPTGPTQAVERSDDHTWHITVTSVRPSDRPEVFAAIYPGEEYLRSSRQLECGHPAVVKMAAEAAGDLTDPVATAVAMEAYVHQQLKSKNFSTALATAAEVAQSLEGDCTEHAVLLAALLRVKDVPSRIVVGLVYAAPHSAFGGHMWTEAFLDGRWVPLDATLGKGGIGAGHIKFADSSLDDDAPAPVTTFLPLIGLLEHMQLQVLEQK
jgi:hypothetical protein